MVLGDYCMGPADHVSELFGNDNFTLGVVEFFVKCEGSNPLQDSLSNITSQFDKLIDQRDLVNNMICVKLFKHLTVLFTPLFRMKIASSSHLFFVFLSISAEFLSDYV